MSQVNRVADVGHWLLAAWLVFAAVLQVRSGILFLIGDAAAVGGQATRSTPIVVAALTVAFIGVLVWGIVTWANWAHALLVVGGALGAIALAWAIVTGQLHRLDPFSILYGSVNMAFFVWLLLPPVRHEYWRPERAQ
jgi:hypothetical protein